MNETLTRWKGSSFISLASGAGLDLGDDGVERSHPGGVYFFGSYFFFVLFFSSLRTRTPISISVGNRLM
jgi:hypothetical protein